MKNQTTKTEVAMSPAAIFGVTGCSNADDAHSHPPPPGHLSNSPVRCNGGGSHYGLSGGFHP